MADVLALLRHEGLATSDADDVARIALAPEWQADLPWFLRVAVGVGAWTATGFFLAFLVMTVGADHGPIGLVLGATLVALALWSWRRTSSEFMRQVAVATSLAGQGLMLFAFHTQFESPRTTAVFAAAFSVALIWFMPDRVHRFLSALAFVVAAYVAVVGEKTLHGFEAVTLGLVAVTAMVWRYRLRDRGARVEEMLVPVRYALVMALFAVLLFGTSTHFGHVSIDSRRVIALGPWTTIGMTLALALLAWKIVDEHGDSLTSGTAFAALAGIVVLGFSSLSAPGIIAAAAVLTLAFDRRDRILLGIGVIFLLLFGSVYYYSLHITLLEKSGVLAASGALLLGIRQRLARA